MGNEKKVKIPELLNLLLIKYNLIEISDYIKFINNPPKDVDKKYFQILKDNKHLII